MAKKTAAKKTVAAAPSPGFTKVDLIREAGSSTIWASWNASYIKTNATSVKGTSGKKKGYKQKRKEFAYRWWYWVTDTWFPASNSDSTLGSGETKVSYSIPSNATYVKFCIRPVMYPVNKKAKKENDRVFACPTFTMFSVSTQIKATPSSSDPVQEDPTPATISSINQTIDKSNKMTLSVSLSDEEVTKKGVSTVDFELYIGTTNTSTQGFSFCAKNNARVYNGRASWTRQLTAGYYYIYKARANGTKGSGQWSNFSDYTEKIVTGATTPEWDGNPTATGSNIVRLKFKCSGYAEEYEIEYATKELYLNGDSGVSQTKTVTEENREATTHNITAFIDNLEAGSTYYFHIRAKSSKFDPTGWSVTKSITIGREPAAPTTYSSKTSAIIGNDVYLYWVHNSQDGSSQRDARIALYVNQTSTMLDNAVVDIHNPYFEDDVHDYLKDKTLFHKITLEADSKYAGEKSNRRYSFVDGDTLYWKVCTRGVYTGNSTNGNGYGPWSAIRKISMFSPPEAFLDFKKGWLWHDLNLKDHTVPLDQLESTMVIDGYPYVVEMWAKPDTQEAISFTLTISNAGGAYETEDAYGGSVTVGAGEVIYQNYFDANVNPESGNYYFDEDNENHMALQLTPNDVDFVNGQTYTFHLEVYMNSGLSAEKFVDIPAQLVEAAEFEPSCYIDVDPDEFVAYITPACYDINLVPRDPETGEIDEEDLLAHLTQDVLLNVYRIETDGTFTEIETGIENTGSVTITDPHPSLDYARYRVVAIKTTSGAIRYDDFFDEMGVHSLVLQWDESWTVANDNAEAYTYENDLSNAEAFRVMTNYKGNRIVLPWNIDMTENFDPDVALIEYIGREHPVSYYGTQLGQSASWSTDIVKYSYDSDEYQDFDTNTLFQLRRLARYMGDVYVREPSGTGYWANVRVNWTQTHNEQVIPVSIEIKRVEGREEGSL